MARVTTAHEKYMSIRDGAAAYADLRQRVVAAGILNRSYIYYTFVFLIVVVGFFGSGYMLFMSRSLWAIIGWSLALAAFSIQCAGIIHDAGHRAIFKSSKLNDFVGHLFGVLIGLSYAEWKPKHDMHHSHVNQVDEDPDLDVPLLSFTKERLRAKKGIGRFLARYQAYLYYPMGSFVAFTLRLAGVSHYKKNFKPHMLAEVLLYYVSVFIWLVGPFLVFDIGKALIVFFVVHLTTGMYALHIFAPNHKGMPEIGKGLKLSFFEQQIITSRNVNPGFFSDIFYMGLNYQIEHHLFPATPRINLPKLSQLVKKACRKHKLEYTSVSIAETDKIILRELYHIAKTA